jgi:hypothetical protein
VQRLKQGEIVYDEAYEVTARLSCLKWWERHLARTWHILRRHGVDPAKFVPELAPSPITVSRRWVNGQWVEVSRYNRWSLPSALYYAPRESAKVEA